MGSYSDINYEKITHNILEIKKNSEKILGQKINRFQTNRRRKKNVKTHTLIHDMLPYDILISLGRTLLRETRFNYCQHTYELIFIYVTYYYI